MEDLQLQRAVEILGEDDVFENLLKKYHKDTHETQVAASADEISAHYGPNGRRAESSEREEAPEAEDKEAVPAE